MTLSIKLDFPIYASASTGPKQFIVGGGGGQGSHGVKNKIVLLTIGKDSIEEITNYEFPPRSDSVMSITSKVSKDQADVLVGVNVPTKKSVDHMHQFHIKDDHITSLKDGNPFEFEDVLQYEKLSSLGDYTLLASSDPKAQIVVIDSKNKQQQFTLDDEVIGLAQTSSCLIVASPTKIELRSLKDCSSVLTHLDNPYKWSRVALLDDSHLAAVSGSNLEIIEFNDGAKEIKSVEKCPTKMRSVCALTTSFDKIAVASSNGEITIFEYVNNKLKVVQKLGRQFALPVTSLSFSSDGVHLLSTSLDGVIKVHKPGTTGSMKLLLALAFVVFFLAFVSAKVQQPKFLHAVTQASTRTDVEAADQFDQKFPVVTPPDPQFEDTSFEETLPEQTTTDVSDFQEEVQTPDTSSSYDENTIEPEEEDVTDPALEKRTQGKAKAKAVIEVEQADGGIVTQTVYETLDPVVVYETPDVETVYVSVEDATETVYATPEVETVFVNLEGNVETVYATPETETVYVNAEGNVETVYAEPEVETVYVNAEGNVETVYASADVETVYVNAEGDVETVYVNGDVETVYATPEVETVYENGSAETVTAVQSATTVYAEPEVETVYE